MSGKSCLGCGVALTPEMFASRFMLRRSKYCGFACYERSRCVVVDERPCRGCGRVMTRGMFQTGGMFKRATFCSDGCYRSTLRTNRVEVVDAEMSRLTLAGGVVALISTSDIERVATEAWHISRRGYVASASVRTLHRFLLSPPADRVVDHINGNKLDNRRCNLRVVDQCTNLQNAKVPSTNKSGIKGVRWDAERRMWSASLTYRRRVYRLGRFATMSAAAEARRAKEQDVGWAL